MDINPDYLIIAVVSLFYIAFIGLGVNVYTKNVEFKNSLINSFFISVLVGIFFTVILSPIEVLALASGSARPYEPFFIVFFYAFITSIHVLYFYHLLRKM